MTQIHCQRHAAFQVGCNPCQDAKVAFYKPKPPLAEFLGAEPLGKPVVLPLGPSGPGHRHNDHPTSVAAAKSLSADRLTELQALVLEYFQSALEATDEELEDALMGEVPAASTLRKRRGDLVTKGWLRDSGRTRPNRNNRQMVVWELASI